MTRLKDKVAIVTGAANGIGAAIAYRFAAEGARVVMLDIARKDLQKRRAEIEKKFATKVLMFITDVSEEDEVSKSVDAVVQQYGQVDVLVNNAGKNFFSDPMEMAPEAWSDCFNLDLSAAWICARMVIPHMLQKEYGSIINIASVHAHRIIPASFPYPVFKHGLIGLTRALGVEYACRGICVNSISPGLVMTKGTEDYFNAQLNPNQERDRLISAIPSGRAGRPEEIANTAVFLASDEARFINAADIVIDGATSVKYAG